MRNRFTAAVAAVAVMVTLTLACGQKSACAYELAKARPAAKENAAARTTRPSNRPAQRPHRDRDSEEDCDEDDWNEAPGKGECKGCAGPGPDRD